MWASGDRPNGNCHTSTVTIPEGQPPKARTIRFWTGCLIAMPAAIALTLQTGRPPGQRIVIGLMAFGIVFAFNSAVHSYLVLA